ncbi:chemotaxis protein CheX [Peribacillus glennii]|uniref:Chemotaxis protein CheX n=1 Tax=Peribacillus glennii TaxID=2303991 RepID=A0A372LDA2_9BACI|nr:chemotaxis protein CheX [Peribacillus glennii]RFU63921.1 chemotaxis protein CheX [Peribacillus glennii]
MIATESAPFTMLFDGVLASISKVIPVPHVSHDPRLHEEHLKLQFGVLIGFTGGLKGKILFKADREVFSFLGEAMFGMPLEGDMLVSFAGELGNMISGGLCTNVFEQGLTIDITSPTIMEGESRISGFKKAMELPVTFQEKGELFMYFLLD